MAVRLGPPPTADYARNVGCACAAHITETKERLRAYQGKRNVTKRPAFGELPDDQG